MKKTIALLLLTYSSILHAAENYNTIYLNPIPNIKNEYYLREPVVLTDNSQVFYYAYGLNPPMRNYYLYDLATQSNTLKFSIKDYYYISEIKPAILTMNEEGLVAGTVFDSRHPGAKNPAILHEQNHYFNLDDLLEYQESYFEGETIGLNKKGTLLGVSRLNLRSITIKQSFLYHSQSGLRKIEPLVNEGQKVEMIGVQINNTDEVVGFARVPGDKRKYAFLYDRTGEVHAISDGNGEWLECESLLLNDQGTVAGVAIDLAGNRHLFFFDTAKGLRLVASFQGTVRALNNRGEIVGSVIGQDAIARAFIATEGEGIQLLQPESNLPSHAIALNDQGEIVGYYGQRYHEHAFVYDKKRGLCDLSPFLNPSDPESCAIAINQKGEILCNSGTLYRHYQLYLLVPIP